MKIYGVKECAAELMCHSRIIILVHSNPDGDCVGSGLALAQVLMNVGKTVRVVCPHTLPERAEISSQSSSIISPQADDDASRHIASADTVFTM